MIDHADNTTILGRQQRAAVVMLRLLAHDLPAVSWGISSVGSIRRSDRDAIELEGQLGSDYQEDIRRQAALEAWATELGVSPRWTSYRDGQGGKLFVTTVITGVQVEIWTVLNACPAEYRPPVEVGGDPESDPATEAEHLAEKAGVTG
ncbi:hypothetical protein DQ384_36365 [Sphaerisporangium album]|uniref:Uncharacterized protein n=1 Tax=Sphaerisporangium album TaxID=509200 RepID=A0A367EX22_9ACTN|nr:hypothetical protein [Sphaerisporangium album]RCG21937.1 hypothetical protein DQ384_36365 [Sphaerisporangium album]